MGAEKVTDSRVETTAITWRCFILYLDLIQVIN
jgi:hypothetical protein